MSYPPQPPQAPQAPQQPPQYPPQYQQGQYPQGQYQQPYGQYQAVQPKTNTMAVVGFSMSLAAIVFIVISIGASSTGLFWLSWLINLTAFIISIVGSSQVKASRGAQSGKGLAVTGIVLSSVLFGLFVLLVAFALAFAGAFLNELMLMGGFYL